jgi:SsrA-binding protein
LVRARELKRLAGAVEREGRTLAPLKLYFNERGIAKLELALAKGKKAHDKRAAVKDRDWKRQQARLMREKG